MFICVSMNYCLCWGKHNAKPGLLSKSNTQVIKVIRLHLGCTSVRQNNQPRVKYAKLREWVIIANRLYSGLRKNKNESIFP